MKKVIESVLAGILLAGGVGLASTLSGANTALLQQQPVKNIVLVHGAFADGTSWRKVIPILESRGSMSSAFKIRSPLCPTMPMQRAASSPCKTVRSFSWGTPGAVS